ncbi:hypothetical protein F5882DRAFT_2468 [Hyaloscypha sp. PMI_1271]|nr:hypothetical protein F5882DRAFT_2468 [Hyaloscypha sp. PMI_1271]
MSGGWSDGTPQIARLLGASEQDESTEAPLLHLKSLYCFALLALLCFALLCFALLCFALLQITGCSAGPRSDLRWLLYSIHTAWLVTYLAPRLAFLQPAHHQALALSRVVPQRVLGECPSVLTTGTSSTSSTFTLLPLELENLKEGASLGEGNSAAPDEQQCSSADRSAQTLRHFPQHHFLLHQTSRHLTAIVEKCPPPCDLRQTRLSNSARTPRIGLSVLQGIFLHTLSQWSPRRISNTLPLSNLV